MTIPKAKMCIGLCLCLTLSISLFGQERRQQHQQIVPTIRWEILYRVLGEGVETQPVARIRSSFGLGPTYSVQI